MLAPVLALAAIIAFVVLVRRRGRPSAGFWVLLGVLAAYWLSIGLSAGPSRQPTTERYIFPGAVILLLVVAEATRGARLKRPIVVGLAALTTLSVAVNLIHIREARTFLTAYATNARSTLAMVELGGDSVRPGLRPGELGRRVSPVHIGVTAEGYLRGVSNWGSPAATLQEVRTSPPVIRDRADAVLSRSLGVRLVPTALRAPPTDCAIVEPAAGGRPAVVRLAPGGAVLRRVGGAGGEVSLRRFGDSFGASAGLLAPGGRMLLEIPPDRARVPWYASVPGRTEICAVDVGRQTARYCELQRALARSDGRTVEDIRALAAELIEVAPPEIEGDVRAVLAGAFAGAPARLAAAQRRIDGFESRRCGG
jgi:hypothetical protein